ncbi:MAG: hypothetical protein GY757_46020, partial [bacterium]|nr:hypothetical protein [bacterium]
GAKINEKNAKGNSALLFALQFDQAENAGLLIKKGADINIKAQNGWTPLMNALRYDQPENAALMIKKGADVNARNQDSWTPLFFALRYKQPENARRIIEKGADLNTTISGGWSPLLIALRNDQAENAKLIINKGADINARSDSNWSPLLMALKYDQPENARILIEKGADVTIKNNNGLSAIALAQTKNYSEIIRLLKKSGIKVPTASTPENSYVQPSEYTNQFTASRKPAPPKPVEEQKAILTSMGFPIPPATITFKVGDCAGKQSCFADIEVNSSKKEVFNFLKSQLQKGGWVIDQAICARKENGSLKKKSLWGLINVNKGYITQTVLIPSNKAKKFKKTQVTLSFFSRAPKHSVMVSNFVKSIPKVTGFGNKMNQRFEFGNWAVTVRSAFTTGTSITKKKYFKKKPYVFSINQKGGVHLLRVKVALERLDHKPIKKSFLTDVTVRSTTGSLYKWLAAGTEHGEYFVRNGGTKSMLIPMQPKSDDIEYVFAIPTNATITHFIWEAKNLIAIQAK